MSVNLYRNSQLIPIAGGGGSGSGGEGYGFLGTQAEWDAIVDKSEYIGKVINITDDYDEDEPTSSKWIGTQDEWGALSDKSAYDGKEVIITDDMQSNVCSSVAGCVASTDANDVAGASALSELNTALSKIFIAKQGTTSSAINTSNEVEVGLSEDEYRLAFCSVAYRGESGQIVYYDTSLHNVEIVQLKGSTKLSTYPKLNGHVNVPFVAYFIKK